jgi:hypothetical protein
VKIPPDAIIATEKLTRYLLVSRPRNDKSRYLAQGGFTPGKPTELEASIRHLAASVESVEEGADEYGVTYTVTGPLAGPNGIGLPVVAVWIRRWDNQRFYFVTLKPHRENRS